MDLQSLYKELVLEESRNDEHRHDVPGATHTGEGTNPSCGDELTLSLKVEGDTIVDAAFQGVGCAISQASASIMCGLLKGATVDEAKQMLKDFLNMIRTGEVEEASEERLGDAMALQDISHMPARVKCAVMAWHTALNLLGETVDNEEESDDFLD